MTTLSDGNPVEKYCPNHQEDVRLVIRIDEQVLGCPQCDYTEPIPEHILMELMGQERLL